MIPGMYVKLPPAQENGGDKANVPCCPCANPIESKAERASFTAPHTAGMYDYHRECQAKRPRSLNYMGAPRASLRRVEQSKSIT